MYGCINIGFDGTVNIRKKLRHKLVGIFHFFHTFLGNCKKKVEQQLQFFTVGKAINKVEPAGSSANHDLSFHKVKGFAKGQLTGKMF